MKYLINLLLIMFVCSLGELNAQTIHYTSTNVTFESGIATFTYYINPKTAQVVKNGKMEYTDESHKLNIIGVYKENKRDGKWDFKIDNRILTGHFSNDNLVGTWNYTEEERTRVIASKNFDQYTLSNKSTLVELSKTIKALILKRN